MPQGVADSVIEPAPVDGRAKPAGRARWRRRIPGFATLAVFAALALVVLASQNRFVGFEPGYDERQPRHHGWVSSHALAIISHATAENGFVGYALAYAGPNGTIRYDYFDRYPVFFSAAMHQALSITERLSSKVYIAKQIMNLIFLATLFFAALIVDKLVGSRPAALAAAVLAMSSEYLLFYKDMVHFDQPALLGMMVLVYTLALYRIDGRRRAPYLGAVLAVSMGRGYASFSVLLVWLVLEAAPLLRRPQLSWRLRLGAFLRLPALRACLLGFGLGAVFLAYNVGMESARTGAAPLQTSILQSAENRLGFDPAFNLEFAAVVSWDGFLRDQLDRLVRWSVPLRKLGGETLPNLLILAAALAVIALQVSHWDRDRQAVAILLLVPGFVWLIAMRNMSGPHEYTSMYYLGVPLLFYASAFSLLRVSGRPLLGWGLLAAALILFLIANQQTQSLHQHLETRSDPVGRLSQFTWDMMAIRERLPRDGKIVALSQELPNAPYGLGFYLPGLVRGSLDEADFIIARDPDALPGNLTPENKRLFVFPRPSEP